MCISPFLGKLEVLFFFVLLQIMPGTLKTLKPCLSNLVYHQKIHIYMRIIIKASSLKSRKGQFKKYTVKRMKILRLK